MEQEDEGDVIRKVVRKDGREGGQNLRKKRWEAEMRELQKSLRRNEDVEEECRQMVSMAGGENCQDAGA